MKVPQYQLIDIVSQSQDIQRQLPTINIKNDSLQGVQIDKQAQGILQNSFVMGVLGKPGSGKSTLIQHLITQQRFYSHKFQRILYVGPTIYKNFKHIPPIIQDQYNWRRNIDIKWVFDCIKQANQWQCKTMLIIFDDVITYMKDSSLSKQCQQLFFNRRHLLQNGCINIIVTSQKWTSFPKFVRTGLTSLITFSINKYQCQSVWKQTTISLARANFTFIVSNMREFQYLFINFSNVAVDVILYNRMFFNQSQDNWLVMLTALLVALQIISIGIQYKTMKVTQQCACDTKVD